MPVSRKRKKKSGKPARSMQQSRRAFDSEADRVELAKALHGMSVYWEHIDAEQTARAAEAATGLVEDLLAVVAGQPDLAVEDALCQRLGQLAIEDRQSHPDNRFGPRKLAQALVAAAADAVEAAAGEATAWRVFTAVAGVLPEPDSEFVLDAIERLDATLPPGPVVSGPVAWTRDRYGSRFAIIAPITSDGQPERWYLWDIDACGNRPFTVHCGFHDTAEAALAEWRAGVGQIAAAGTTLTPVDDSWLADELLPLGQAFADSGGETVGPFSEYYRSPRLAEAVRQALPRSESHSARELDTAAAAKEFTTWLRARDTDQRQLPEDLDELAAELAGSWCINGIEAVYWTCSPHRVGLCADDLDCNLEDNMEEVVALLPDWTRFLAERNDTPSELADRCLPYAEGEPHPHFETADERTFPRVIE